MKFGSTKKALAVSVISLVVCISLLVGTTFAWFTDSVTSANNIIKSGNLDVELYYQAEGQDTWTKVDQNTNVFKNDTLWEPGHTEVVKFKVVNEGSLALKYMLGVNVASEIGSVNVNGDSFKLSDFIKFGMTRGAQTYTREQAVAAAEANGATALNIAYSSDSIALLPKTASNTDNEDTVTMVVYMPETVGNEANYAKDAAVPTINLGVNLVATQYTHEEDSFGADYDTEATYPAATSGVFGADDTLKAGEVEVTLPTNAAEDVYTLEIENKTVETYAGETVISLDINLLKNGVKVEAEANTFYAVTVEVGKGLLVTGVTHKGEAVETFAYDPTTGIVSFETESFSPFTVSYSNNVFKINTADELIEALTDIKTDAKQKIPGENGNKAYRVDAVFVLDNDIVIDSANKFMYTDSNGAPLHFYGVNGVLNLNGHSITVTENALMSGKTSANAVLLVQYSNLTIIGEGDVIAKNKSIPVYGWANGTVDIYGGNYVTNASERNESAVYVNNTSMLINVYGGTFTDSAYAFNVHDNCKTSTTIVLHEGVTYKDFLKNGTVDVTASDLNNGRIALAEGCELYEFEENGTKMYTVVK